MNKSKKKVYCSYCKYLLDTIKDGGDLNCTKEIMAESPFARYKKQIWDAYEQNKKNNCKYYEYKKYKPIKI